MKFFQAIVGGQLLLAATVFATPMPDAGNVVARSPVAAPVPGCIKERGTEEDALNICCLKLKRDAEIAADTAANKSKLYEKAMAVRERLGDLVARDALPEALPGCIKGRESNEDALNICCLKRKRDAEAAATAAAAAYSDYAQMLEYRSL